MRWRWRNIPLPEPHLGALAAGIALQWTMPMAIPRAAAAVAVGVGLTLVGLVVVAWAVRTAADFRLSSGDRLLVTGPYARSRHPMYVAWTACYVGLTAMTGNGWLAVLLPVVLLLTHITVLREERRLRTRFGEDYRRYARTVRRYGL
jgi:protein-S-isoprenylcysteine O-methyltransferase Ste14